MEINSIWYEKYSPKTLDDVILPENVKKQLEKWVSEGKLPNLGFWSQLPGLGKSSTCKAIINTMGADALFINASLEKGIDVLRSKILQFASSSSLDDSPKLVIMDECDNITRDAQAAFRGFLDEFSGNCSFIFTGNYKSKMIEPLLDRLQNYDFATFSKQEMVKPIFEKLKYITENEGVEFNDEVKTNIVKIIQNCYPRIRNMIGCLQRSLTNGTFEIEQEGSNFEEIIQTMRAKDYQKLLGQVNSLPNPDAMFEYLYKNVEMFSNLPQAVLVLAKGQFQAEQVRDKNLNLASVLVELMNCL